MKSEPKGIAACVAETPNHSLRVAMRRRVGRAPSSWRSTKSKTESASPTKAASFSALLRATTSR